MATLIVGGNGFIGKELVLQMKSRGEKVHLWSSIGDSEIVAETGMMNEHAVIPDQVETIVYLSQSPYYRDSKKAVHLMNVNSITPIELFLKAQESGVKRFIYMSTGSVYDASFDPLSESSNVIDDNWYKLSKLTGEKGLSLAQSTAELCIVRPFGVFGPGQKAMLVANLISNIKNNSAITLNKKSSDEKQPEGLKISLCYVEDAAKIIINLVKADKVPSVVNLAGLEPISIKKIATTVADYLNIDLNLQVDESVRNFDLIADTGAMEDFVNFEMTPFSQAIEKTISQEV